MKKNPKYSKEEMYLAKEIWQESGITQAQFCERENIPVTTVYIKNKLSFAVNYKKKELQK